MSADRSANPSIAELANGGRSTSARAALASTRPAARRAGASRPTAGRPARARAGGPPRRRGARSRCNATGRIAIASGRDLGGRPRPRRGAERGPAPRRARCCARAARPPVGGGLRRRRLDGRDVRRLTRLTPRTRTSGSCAAAQLRQGGRARRRVRRGDRRRRSSRSTATCRTTRPRSGGCSPSSTRATTSSRAGRRREGPGRQALLPAVQTVSRPGVGPRLHDMNCGLKAYRAEVAREIQLYGELHRYIPRARLLPRLPRDGGPGQPPTARARPVEVRRRSATSAGSSICSP